MFCNKCGNQIDDTTEYCSHCGAKVGQTVQYSWDFNNQQNYDESYGDVYDTDYEVGRDNKNTVKVLIICIAVILVAAIFGVGAYILSNNAMTEKSDKKPSKPKTAETEAVEEKDTPQEEKTENKPVKLTCSASSNLANDNSLTYYASNAFDGDKNTCWTEGYDGDGIGEYISVSFSTPITIQKLGILNGYTKTKSLYEENSRPKELKVIFHTEDANVQKYLSLKDEYNLEQEFTYEEALEKVKSIDIYVENIYFGSKYHDTCISDIYFYDSDFEPIEFVK